MSKDSYLVIGGCGFLGQHMVNGLLARGDLEVAVLDLVLRDGLDPRVRFFSGDITNQRDVEDALRKANVTCVIHTASPVHGLGAEIYQKVNVVGTQTVIAACLATDVKKLVYTSTASVVFSGVDAIDADERLPPLEESEHVDAYTASKAKAEDLVLKANGSGNLKTVAIRPAGIFGPGDRQMIGNAKAAIKSSHYQLGDNNNLFDFSYVGNVVDAHLLAADKLSIITSPLSPETFTAIPLDPITATTGTHRIPTSTARPPGPTVNPQPEDDERLRKFRLTDAADESAAGRPVLRSRYDPFNPAVLQDEIELGENNPLQVAGQAFFISNGEPVYFWDFMRLMWVQLGAEDRPVRVIPKWLAYPLAQLGEWYGWLVGKEPSFTKFRVMYTCATRYHNIEKARRVLGYEPKVGLEEGVKRMVDWFVEHGGK